MKVRRLALKIRYRNYSKLMALAKDRFPEIRRLYRFGIGTYMTIPDVDEETLFGERGVDFEELTYKLNLSEFFVECRRLIEIGSEMWHF